MIIGAEKIIYGFIEHATLVDKNLMLSAKLDTGAQSASLNATKITEITICNKKYLKFIVPSKTGDIEFQAEYIGKVSIKSRAGEKFNPLFRKYINRPVVIMPIKLGNLQRDIKVNLANRKRFIYPLLLGRDAINAFNGVVNPDAKYIITKSSL